MSALDFGARARRRLERERARRFAYRAGSPALAALAQGQFRPVDLVCFGDSTQLVDGHGWDGALTKAFAQDERFGIWASALYPQERVPSTGLSSQGWNVYSAVGVAGATTGADAAFDDRRHPHPLGNYLYEASGDIGNSNGLVVPVVGELDVDAALRYHIYYGTFGSGSGSFRPTARMGQSPWTTLVDGSVISTNTGAIGEASTYIDLAAAARGHAVQFMLQRPGGTASVGPTIFLGQRIENRDKAHGVSLHSFYATGGASLYDTALYFQDTISAARAMWGFGKLRALQIARGHKPVIVVRLCFGLNDRNETGTPTRGPLAYTGSGSDGTAYADNLNGLVDTLETAWEAQGWPLDELFFHIVTSYPVAEPDDMVGYRSAARLVIASRKRCGFVDMAMLVPQAETMAHSGLSDGTHFTSAWADEIARREVGLIPALGVVA